MSTQHTPGPWYTQDDPYWHVRSEQHGCVFAADYAPCANRLLIAAAPDLLAPLLAQLAHAGGRRQPRLLGLGAGRTCRGVCACVRVCACVCVRQVFCFARTLAAARSWNAASGFFFHNVMAVLITTWWALLMPIASIKCTRSLISFNSMTSPPKPLLMMAGV